jgi:hypothetical protein
MVRSFGHRFNTANFRGRNRKIAAIKQPKIFILFSKFSRYYKNVLENKKNNLIPFYFIF